MRKLVGAVALAIATGSAGPSLSAAQFPYELESRRELAIFGTGAVLGTAHLVVQARQEPLRPEQLEALHPDQVPRFDRIATRRWSPAAARASDILVYGLLASPLALAAAGEGRKEPGVVLTMYAETLLLNSAVVQLLKGWTNRVRPYGYNEDPRVPLEMKLSKHAVRSFPSGHAGNAFAGAVFLGEVFGRLHPDSSARPWVWTVSLSAATATAVLRVLAGKHFVSDVVVGSAIGAAAGAVIPRLHELDDVEGSNAPAPMLSFGLNF
jgi:membrane-associated phospholipid phosphatase